MEIGNDDVRVRLYHTLADLFKLLDDPKCIRILEALLIQSPRNFTDMHYYLRMPSNMLSKNLKSLQKFNLVKKTEDGSYRITDIGKMALDANLKNIFQLIREVLDRDESAM